MKKFHLLGCLMLINPLCYAKPVPETANGIKYPSNLKNWRLIASSYRQDNNTQRVILGNSIAINAARSTIQAGWPNGSMLAKLVWKNKQHPQWKPAIIPGKLLHTEIMIKNDKKFRSTGGWGYARWKGEQLTPYGKDKSFAQECYSCHNQVKETDYVFTFPAQLP